MNTVVFSDRLRECRKRKFSSQQAFADAYLKRYGLIREKGKKKEDNNMFGTVQKWEQGKSTPTADVLCNICDLLDCDADYLLGRINERTHDINDAQRYTGLSAQALEQLHEYRNNLATEPDWAETRELEDQWSMHKYYQAFSLYLIDELLTGSEHHKLSATALNGLFEKMEDWGFAVNPEDYDPEDDANDREFWAAKEKETLDIAAYSITSNIRDIIVENAINNKFPPALEKAETKSGNCYFFSIKK